MKIITLQLLHTIHWVVFPDSIYTLNCDNAISQQYIWPRILQDEIFDIGHQKQHPTQLLMPTLQALFYDWWSTSLLYNFSVYNCLWGGMSEMLGISQTNRGTQITTKENFLKYLSLDYRNKLIHGLPPKLTSLVSIGRFSKYSMPTYK